MNSILIEKRNSSFNQRGNRERRTSSFPSPKYWGSRGRRRQIRRSGDRTEIYLDRYPPGLFWGGVITLGLCAMDAALTLGLLQRGAVEINPFMAWLIRTNLMLFVGVKMAFTALGLLCLIVHQNFIFWGRFQGRQLVYAFLGLYLGVVAYEGVLFYLQNLS